MFEENKSGIYKVRLNLPYFTYYNESAQDPDLSMQAKGLLAYLLSLPEEWKIRVVELQNHFSNGRDAVANALKELIDHELVRKIEVRDENGKFKENIYQVFPVKYQRAIDMGLIAGDKKTDGQDPEEKIPYKEIIDHLNIAASKNFKHTTGSTRKAINGRWSDGYRLDDFIYVIDVKAVEWKGTEMDKHLCPETLFRPGHFEKYRNQKMKQSKAPQFKKKQQGDVFDKAAAEQRKIKKMRELGLA